MELVAPNTYVDGAHNDDAIRKLVYSIVCAFPEKDIYLVFAVAEDKDYRQMVRTLCGLDNLKGVVVTELDNGRRRDYHEVMEHFQDNWHGKIQGTYNVNEAIATGQQWQGQDGILICTGSLYLVGHVKEILGGI
jgi:dihydrofolate synthase/folylpolyglutamate synthase